jgi:hypothetical protein
MSHRMILVCFAILVGLFVLTNAIADEPVAQPPAEHPTALTSSGERPADGGSEEVVNIGGLMWQKAASASYAMNWSKAIQYCENLSLGGYGGWRLPSISELRSIIRGCPKTRSGGACGVTDSCRKWNPCRNDSCSGCSMNQGPANGCYWPDELTGNASWLWSSSSREDDDNDAWGVIFNLGFVSNANKSAGGYARCVRDRP